MAMVKCRVICNISIPTDSCTESEIAQEIIQALQEGSSAIEWQDIDLDELEIPEDFETGQYDSDRAYEERRDREAA